jgi:hypothetical protein
MTSRSIPSPGRNHWFFLTELEDFFLLELILDYRVYVVDGRPRSTTVQKKKKKEKRRLQQRNQGRGHKNQAPTRLCPVNARGPRESTGAAATI